MHPSRQRSWTLHDAAAETIQSRIAVLTRVRSMKVQLLRPRTSARARSVTVMKRCSRASYLSLTQRLRRRARQAPSPRNPALNPLPRQKLSISNHGACFQGSDEYGEHIVYWSCCRPRDALETLKELHRQLAVSWGGNILIHGSSGSAGRQLDVPMNALLAVQKRTCEDAAYSTYNLNW
jgi:hypothetical protein